MKVRVPHGSHDSACQVKQHVRRLAHLGVHRVAENPQEQHVAADVQPVGVHELVGEKLVQGHVVAGQRQPFAQRLARAERRLVGPAKGEESQDVHRDEPIVGPGRPADRRVGRDRDDHLSRASLAARAIYLCADGGAEPGGGCCVSAL